MKAASNTSLERNELSQLKKYHSDSSQLKSSQVVFECFCDLSSKSSKDKFNHVMIRCCSILKKKINLKLIVSMFKPRMKT